VSQIGKLWAGKLFGTNTGNVSAELTSEGNNVVGTVRFLDDKFGPVVYEVKGAFDGSVLEFSGDAVQAPSEIQTGTITVKGALTPQGDLRGQWSSTLGTGGTFHLFPHDVLTATPQTGSLPEQLHTATRPLGAIRLVASDLEELIGFLRRDFNQGRVVVTYHERGTEISKYAADFFRDMAHLRELRYLKLMVQEPEAHGLNRVATIELNANGNNEVRVQGIQESWVVGKAEALAAQLKRSEKTLSTTFRKFGLNLNGLMALIAILVIPELPLNRRIVFVVVVMFVSWVVIQIHSRFIPNFAIHLAPDDSSGLAAWPQIVSWLVAVTSGFVAALAYGLLKGELPVFANWFAAPFH
jgi:hypothetical protein